MKFKTLATLLLGIVPSLVMAESKKVLVVLSSENKITLKDGIEHPTGFFLSELMVPTLALIKAGYTPVFANPKGNEPTMDVVSDKAMWFANEEEYKVVRKAYLELTELRRPKSLSNVIEEGLDQYAGVFVPGGHAPMEDLIKDSDMGEVLRYFHGKGKPTALICHGPIALLAALGPSIANAFGQLIQLKSDNSLVIENLTKNWIYKGYKMTVFSTKEEKQEEPGQDNALGGFVKFYPDEALGIAGGHVLVNAIKWKSNVVVDRELITGENPFSDKEVAKELVKALNAQQ